MKLSQLLHVIDKEDIIFVNDFNKQIENCFLYSGKAKDARTDKKVCEMHVLNVTACDEDLLILVIN